MSYIVHLTLQQINVTNLVTELIVLLFCDVAIGTSGVFPIIGIVEVISTLYLASRLTFVTSLCWKE